MRMGTTMQDTFNTPSSHLTTVLGRIGRDPSRLMTVREWWHEMDEPVEMLADPLTTFAEDEREIIQLCLAHRISYRPVEDGQRAAFPAWMFLRAYPENP